MERFAAMDILLQSFLPNTVVEYTVDFVQGNESLSNLEGWETIDQTLEQLNNTLVSIASVALPPLLTALGFLIDNFSILLPLILGFGGAFGVFQIAARWVSIVENTTNLAKKAMKGFKLATQIMSMGLGDLRGKTASVSAATLVFNSTLLASPVTWIVMGIMALVGVLFAAASAVAKFTGVADSGFGVICGAINVVIQFFKNLGLSVANIFLGIINGASAVGSNIKSFFSVAIANIQYQFWSLAETVANINLKIMELLNKLPFVEIDTTSWEWAADHFAQKAQEAQDTIQNTQFKDVGAEFTKGFHTYETFGENWVGEAFASGAEWGDQKSAQISDGLSSFGIGGGMTSSEEVMNSGAVLNDSAIELNNSSLNLNNSSAALGDTSMAFNDSSMALSASDATSNVAYVSSDNWEKELNAFNETLGQSQQLLSDFNRMLERVNGISEIEMETATTERGYTGSYNRAESLEEETPIFRLDEETLERIRQLAEEKPANEYTTANIRIEMVNHMNVKNANDAAPVIDQLKNGLYEALANGKEKGSLVLA